MEIEYLVVYISEGSTKYRLFSKESLATAFKDLLPDTADPKIIPLRKDFE